jgi:hypothetical protein
MVPTDNGRHIPAIYGDYVDVISKSKADTLPPCLVLATVPVLDPAGNIGLLGNGLTLSNIDEYLSELSL